MKKVVVGMSGGVDSAVAAYLLKKAGYEVIAIFMRNWDSEINNDVLGNPNVENDVCTQDEDLKDARKVSEKLGIEFHEVNFVKEYWDYVFEYFLDELKRGRTPNPDIMCNKYIKFDAFVKEAKKYGAEYIATGHYARYVDGKLLRAFDDNKDQTYFLSQLSRDQLKNVLFPVGELNKNEVRDIAKTLELEVFDKKDSTGICFIGERKFREFLRNYLPAKKGDIVYIENNKKLGEHNGLMNYTIGQRRGLDIGGTADKLFVVGKNLDKNILYVAEGEDNRYLYSDSCIISDFNLISDIFYSECTAKFRYRQKDVEVTLEKLPDDKVLVKYNGVKAVTPGQACVFYKEDECIGGGIIETVYFKGEKLEYL